MSWKNPHFSSKKIPPVSPTTQPVVQIQKQVDVIKPVIEPNLQVPERPNARTEQRPYGKRIITRNSFEIYEDQMDSLRKLSYQEKMDGKLGSMRMEQTQQPAFSTFTGGLRIKMH
jgi:hypothetical protein